MLKCIAVFCYAILLCLCTFTYTSLVTTCYYQGAGMWAVTVLINILNTSLNASIGMTNDNTECILYCVCLTLLVLYM